MHSIEISNTTLTPVYIRLPTWPMLSVMWISKPRAGPQHCRIQASDSDKVNGKDMISKPVWISKPSFLVKELSLSYIYNGNLYTNRTTIIEPSFRWLWNHTPFCPHCVFFKYRQVSNIRLTLVGNKIVDHSDVVGASPVGAAPTTSSLST